MSASLATASALSFAGALAFNVLLDGRQGNLQTLAAAVSATAATGVALIAFIAQRSSKASHWPEVETAAVGRIRATIRAALMEDQPVFDLQLSITAPGCDTDQSQSITQTTNAFIAESTSNPQCTVITGAPGAGKTTLLMQLALSMAKTNLSQKSSYIPLLLECRSWRPEHHLSTWVEGEARRVYGLPDSLTRDWLRRGSTVLLLDGADEIAPGARTSFMEEVNYWLTSPIGGRAFVACRTDTYLDTFCKLRHERVANLQPLPPSAIADFISRSVLSTQSQPSTMHNIRTLLKYSDASKDNELPDVRTPLLVRMLATGIKESTGKLPSDDAVRDPSVIAIELGDSLRTLGDRQAALDSYNTVIDDYESRFRSLAGVRAMLLLAEMGDYRRARGALQHALAAELTHPLRDELPPIESHLEDDERGVLSALTDKLSLDEFQISSLTSLSPSRCNRALRQLRDRGLVELTADGDMPRFQRSAVELIAN
jgi:hypothetical protein